MQGHCFEIAARSIPSVACLPDDCVVLVWLTTNSKWLGGAVHRDIAAIQQDVLRPLDFNQELLTVGEYRRLGGCSGWVGTVLANRVERLPCSRHYHSALTHIVLYLESQPIVKPASMHLLYTAFVLHLPCRVSQHGDCPAGCWLHGLLHLQSNRVHAAGRGAEPPERPRGGAGGAVRVHAALFSGKTIFAQACCSQWQCCLC